MIELSTIFKRSAHQMSCKLNNEVAILDTDRTIYFGLQGVAVQIWDALERPCSVANLCASILTEFDVAPDECRADVLQLLADLQQAGLVEVAADAG